MKYVTRLCFSSRKDVVVTTTLNLQVENCSWKLPNLSRIGTLSFPDFYSQPCACRQMP